MDTARLLFDLASFSKNYFSPALRNGYIKKILQNDEYLRFLSGEACDSLAKKIGACLHIAWHSNGSAKFYLNEEDKNICIDLVANSFSIQQEQLTALSCLDFNVRKMQILSDIDNQINIKLTFPI